MATKTKTNGQTNGKPEAAKSPELGEAPVRASSLFSVWGTPEYRDKLVKLGEKYEAEEKIGDARNLLEVAITAIEEAAKRRKVKLPARILPQGGFRIGAGRKPKPKEEPEPEPYKKLNSKPLDDLRAAVKAGKASKKKAKVKA
jgi:hypothetical protein